MFYLNDLESISFRYKLPTQSGDADSVVWAQYTDESKRRVIVLLDYKACECLLPIDYYIISDLTPTGVAYLHIEEDNYRIIYSNNYFIDLLGFDADEKSVLIGHDLLTCLSKEDLLHIDQYRLANKHNDSFAITANMIRKDGSYIQVNLLGRFISPAKKGDALIISISPSILTGTSPNSGIFKPVSDNSQSLIFRYDFASEFISFCGGLVKKIAGKNYLTCHMDTLYANEHTLKFDAQQIRKVIANAKKGKKADHIFKGVGKGNLIYWLKVEYDFVQDIEGRNIGLVGRIHDVSEQHEATEFYDKAISLWHMKYDECESAITINVTEQSIVDGFSDLIPREKLRTMSLSEYLDAICPCILNKSERMRFRQQMNPKRLFAAAKEKSNHLSFDFEISYKEAHHWVRLNITLLKNPKTDHLMALLKCTNINDIITMT